MSDSLKDPLVAGLVEALEGKADEVTIRLREEDPDPREETALSPMLRAVRAATSGTDSDALAMVAEHLGVTPSEVKKWESGEEPIPEEIANKISMRKGGDTEGEYAGCRDEWIIGYSEVPNPVYARYRYYVFHTKPPRFQCRVVEFAPELDEPEDPEDAEAILSGMSFAFYHGLELVEFEWFDPMPSDAELSDLASNAACAWEEHGISFEGDDEEN